MAKNKYYSRQVITKDRTPPISVETEKMEVIGACNKNGSNKGS
jgi:hypothetical protein